MAEVTIHGDTYYEPINVYTHLDSILKNPYICYECEWVWVWEMCACIGIEKSMEGYIPNH